jgi:hypothetical protein
MASLTKKETNQMWMDILKFLTIAFTVHFLSYAIDDSTTFLEEHTIKLFIYITLGVIIYYTAISRLVIQFNPPSTVSSVQSTQSGQSLSSVSSVQSNTPSLHEKYEQYTVLSPPQPTYRTQPQSILKSKRHTTQSKPEKKKVRFATHKI